MNKAEAMAAAPENGATFTEEAWEGLEKDADGNVTCDALKAAASKRGPAHAPPMVHARARGHRRRLQVCRARGERCRRRRARPGRGT